MRQFLQSKFVVVYLILLYVPPGHTLKLCTKDCDGLCNKTTIEVGHGFSAHPKDCEKFVQCWKVGNTVTPFLQLCPFGQFWDEHEVTCRPSYLTRCPTDPCKNYRSGFTYEAEEYGCGAYRVCNDSISYHRCCPGGTAYIEGRGCENDVTCTDECPPK